MDYRVDLFFYMTVWLIFEWVIVDDGVQLGCIMSSCWIYCWFCFIVANLWFILLNCFDFVVNDVMNFWAGKVSFRFIVGWRFDVIFFVYDCRGYCEFDCWSGSCSGACSASSSSTVECRTEGMWAWGGEGKCFYPRTSCYKGICPLKLGCFLLWHVWC